MIIIDKSLEKNLRESARFIKEALAETSSHIEIDHGEGEGEPLRINKDIDAASFTSLSEKRASGNKIAAIDGGSASIVNGRSFRVGVYRCGYLVFEDGKLLGEKVYPPTIQPVSFSNAEEIFSRAHFELLKELPEESPAFDRVIDRVRMLREWSLANELAENLDEGDLILLDGSLRSSVALPYTLIDRVCKKAAQRGVHLAGVVKTSTLYWGKHTPLVPMVHRLGNEINPGRNWFCQLTDLKADPIHPTTDWDIRWFGDIYVAKLSPRSDYAFRVDINRFDETDPKKIVELLVSCSQDPVYMGYPYPLAAIHNRVRIEPAQIEDFYYRLQSFALEEGVRMEEWETLFADFHELLDVSE